MVKKRGMVWNYYDKKVYGAVIIVVCKFCEKSYNQNATRMERHMQQCPKCPEDIRQQFIQMWYNKKNKADILDINVNNVRSRQESSMEHSINNTKLEDLIIWNYQNQSYSDEASSQIQQEGLNVKKLNIRKNENANLIVQNDDQSSANHKTAVGNNEINVNPADRNWKIKQNSTEPVTTARPQERTNSIHQRKSQFPRKIARWPFLSTAGHSPLQSRIFQEQLLERRALRKVAQLELRRKTLELERFQWEYERDKAQSEVRWAHEIRMMKIKEERERHLIVQNKMLITSHVT